MMTGQSSENRGHVLLVDDQADNLDVMTRWLSNAGFTVDCTGSAEDALSWLLKKTPDVVCMDVELPAMGGLEALDQIRLRHPRLPVLLLSGNGDAEMVALVFERGAYAYVPKPVEQVELVAVVVRAIADST